MDEALEAYREQKAKRNLQELRWSEKSNHVSVKAEKETKFFGFPLKLWEKKLVQSYYDYLLLRLLSGICGPSLLWDFCIVGFQAPFQSCLEFFLLSNSYI